MGARGPQPATINAIRAILAQEPDLSARELAAQLGVSRQRVHQVLAGSDISLTPRQLNLPRRARPPMPRIMPSVACDNINHTVAGTIAELIVAADLMARGWQVFFPLVRTTKVDLLATSKDGHRVARIEVRCAARKANGALIFTRKENAVCDHFATVVTGEPVNYQPDLEPP